MTMHVECLRLQSGGVAIANGNGQIEESCRCPIAPASNASTGMSGFEALQSALPALLIAAATFICLYALLHTGRRSAIALAPGAVPLLGNTLGVLYHYHRWVECCRVLPGCRVLRDRRDRPAPRACMKFSLLAAAASRFNDWLLDMSRAVGLGRPFLVSLPLGESYLAITSPAAVEHVLRGNFDNYVKGPELASRLQGAGGGAPAGSTRQQRPAGRRSTLQDGPCGLLVVPLAAHHAGCLPPLPAPTHGTRRAVRRADLLGGGIFNVDGHPWRTQRKLAASVFSVRAFREHCGGAFRAHMVQLLARLDAAADSGEVVDVQVGQRSGWGGGAAAARRKGLLGGWLGWPSCTRARCLPRRERAEPGAGPAAGWRAAACRAHSGRPATPPALTPCLPAPMHGPPPPQDLLFRFTLDAFCAIAFGAEPGCLASEQPVDFAIAFDRSQALVGLQAGRRADTRSHCISTLGAPTLAACIAFSYSLSLQDQRPPWLWGQRRQQPPRLALRPSSPCPAPASVRLTALPALTAAGQPALPAPLLAAGGVGQRPGQADAAGPGAHSPGGWGPWRGSAARCCRAWRSLRKAIWKAVATMGRPLRQAAGASTPALSLVHPLVHPPQFARKVILARRDLLACAQQGQPHPGPSSPSPAPHDLLSLFMGMADEATGQPLPDELLVDYVLNFIIAGRWAAVGMGWGQERGPACGAVFLGLLWSRCRMLPARASHHAR
jgi:hypothetical protein